MKSADVGGKAIPPQVCHTQAEPAGAAGQAVAGKPAVAIARPGSIAAATVQRLAPGAVDRVAREVAAAVGASLLRPEALRVFVVQVPDRHALTVAGYAPAASLPASAAAAEAKASTSTSGKGEWAFLDDRRLSVEDKLFMFMKLVMKKSDQELVKKMKQYQAAKSGGTSASSGSSAAKSSGGLFGILKKVFPPLAALAKVVPALPDLVNKLATQLGPQLLGALMIPLGAPWAAPLVQRAASELLPAAISTLDGGSTGSSPSDGTSGSSATGNGDDERMQLLEIERMMQKTNQMFATVSNILKATHDAAMTAVNNIR